MSEEMVIAKSLVLCLFTDCQQVKNLKLNNLQDGTLFVRKLCI